MSVPLIKPVTVKQGTGAYVPARFGSRELVWQEPTSVITTHTGGRIVITGTRSELVTSHGTSSVSDDVPTTVAVDHAALVAYWQTTAEKWAAETAHLARDEVFEVDGVLVEAQGFTSEQFMRFVDRAKSAQLRTSPAGSAAEAVKVQSGSSPASYAVTRTSCTCRGHQSHGRCYHRALVIWLHYVQGVPVCTVPTIVVNPRVVPLAIGRTPAAPLTEVA